MKYATPAMKDHIASQVTSICTCWKVTRLDGKVFGFTDHDVDLSIEGLLYNASSGFFRSAITNTATTAADNLEVKGFLDDEQITEEELRNGAFDFATVEIFAVNWMDLSQGKVKLRYGIFGETTLTPIGLFTVELRGLTQLFSQTVGEIFTAACRADLGDSRCKIQLIPSLRGGNTKYAVDDRVLCRVDGSHISRIRLPLQNPLFDETIEETHILAWNVGSMCLDNYTYRGVLPGYWVKPTNTNSGEINQTIDLNKWFSDNNTSRADVHIYASLKVHHNSTGWRTRMYIKWEGGLTYSDWSTWDGTVGLADQTLAFDIGIGLTTSYFTIGVQSERLATAPTTAAPVIFTACRSTITLGGSDVSGALYWANQDFDSFLGSYGSPRAWYGSGNLVAATTVMSPYSDPFYLAINNGMQGAYLYQKVPISSIAGVDLTLLDAGGYDVELGALVTALQRGSLCNLLFKFENATGDQIALVELGAKSINLVRNWQSFKHRTRIPAGTRTIEVRLASNFDGGAVYPSVIYDSAYLDIVNPIYETTADYMVYGGVEYRCTTAGTTANVPPTFTGTVGEVVHDGSAVWTCIYPKHTTIYAVAHGSDHKHFTVSATPYGEAKPVDWFTWGVVEFLTGKNIGRKVEVLSYTHPSFTTALSLPYVPEAGDLIRVHTGCDKLRKTCRDKFANVINMRGEPDLPGSGAYFKIGVAK